MLIPLVLSITLSVLTPPPPAQQTSWEVGRPAPHVHLPEIAGGEPIDLAALRGKKVLIAEFASW